MFLHVFWSHKTDVPVSGFYALLQNRPDISSYKLLMQAALLSLSLRGHVTDDLQRASGLQLSLVIPAACHGVAILNAKLL